MNRRCITASALALAVTLAGMPVALRAEQAPAAASSAGAQVSPPTLKVTVVISRYQKDQKTGSLPFVLMVIPATGTGPEERGSGASLQMGAEVPVPSGKDGSYSYRSVGTAIQASATRLADGAYSISLTVSDSQIMSDQQGQNMMRPSFQSFTSQSRVILRDGGSIQYTAASDKSSGEQARIDVTASVVK
jgi:hypothetical protein